MADAFKGLTIRIGADARPLKSEMDSIRKSAGAAQSQIRLLQRAMKDGASNSRLLAQQIGLVEDQAHLAANRANTLKRAIQQNRKETVKFRTEAGLVSKNLGNAERNTKDVYAAQQKANSTYRTFNAELQSAYDKLAKIKEDREGITFEDARKSVKKLVGDLDKTGKKAKSARKELAQLAMGLKAKDLPFNVVSVGNNVKNAQAVINAFKRVRAQQKIAKDELDSFDKMVSFRNVRAQLAAADAELRNLTHDAANARMQLYAMGTSTGMVKATEHIRSMESATDSAMASAQRMREAYNKMPGSIEAAKARLMATQSAQATLNAKVEAYEQKLHKIEANPAFDKQAAKSEDLYMNFEKARDKLARMDAIIQNTNADIDHMQQELDLMKANDAAAEQTTDFKNLRAKIDSAEKRLALYRAEYDDLDKKAETQSLAKEWRRVTEEIQAANGELAAFKSQQRLGGWHAMGNIGSAIKNVGYAAFSTITPAVMMAGRYAIQSAEEIDSAYRNMRKTVNGTEEQFEALKDSAIDFSRTHITSADQMLEIEAIGGQLGIAADNLGAFGEVVANLDVATNIDTEDIATYVGQLSNIMTDIKTSKNDPKAYQKNITSFSDALVRLGNNSAAQESNIMNVMMRIASLGSISGFTTPQLLAISDAVAATGQGSEAAGTAISKTFSNIEQAVGAGGDDLEKFAKVSGMSATEFADAWNNRPMEAFTAFIGGLKSIDDAGGSVDNTLTELGITSVRQKQALEGLTNTFDVLQSATQMSQDAWDGLSTTLADGSIEEAGDAAREASRKAEGFSGQLAIMKNNAAALASELGEGVTPYIQGLSTIFQEFTGWFHELPDGMKTMVVGLMAGAAAIGPIMVGTGSMLTAMANVHDTLAKIPTAWLKVSKAARALPGPIDAIDKAVEFLGGDFTETGVKLLDFKDKLKMKINPAMFGIVTAAAAVSVAAIVGCIQIYSDWRKAVENSKKIRGETAFMRIAKASAKASDSIDGAADSVEEFDAALIEGYGSYNDWVNEVLKGREKLQESLSETIINNKQIDEYAESIENLMEAASGNRILNPEQQAELERSVENFNNLTGESIEIIDKEKGVLKDSEGQVYRTADAFDTLAQKKKDAALAGVYDEAYTETAKRAAEQSAFIGETEAQLDRYRKIGKAFEDGALSEEERAALFPGMSEAEAIAAANAEMQNMGTETQRLNDDLREYKANLEALNKETDVYKELGTLARMASDDAGTAIDRLLIDPSNVNIAQVISSNGQSVLEFADALNALGDDAQKLNADQLSRLAKDFGGDLSSMLPILNEYGISLKDVANTKIGGKDFIVTDNGTIFDTEGKLAGLEAVKIGDKTFWVSDDGTVYDEQNKVNDLSGTKINGKTFVVSDDGSIYDMNGKLQNLKSIEIGGKTFWVSDGGSVYDSEKKITKLDNQKLAKKFVEVGDKGTIKQMKDQLLSLDQTDVDVKVKVSLAMSAAAQSFIDTMNRGKKSGGIVLNANAAGGVTPRHASGSMINGIVTRPTMTNVGLTGEAGNEAIFNMRHAGGAIIPLSNRRYVRPFARAVAYEMPYGGSSTVYNLQFDGVTINSNAEMRAVTKEYLTTMMRLARG